MKIKKSIIINKSADHVWKVFAHDFNNAGKWMSAVPHSYEEQIGQQFESCHSKGRICELDGRPDGLKAVESFLAYDEVNKTCTVDIELENGPALIPINGNVVDFILKEINEDCCEITWVISPKLKDFAYLIYPLVKFGVGVFVQQIIEELKYFAETGEPHPRKIKALKKQQAIQNA
jgi:hypothetical protein